MKVEPTMLVVSGAEAPSDLLAALEEQGVFVERAGPTSFAELLPVVAPDLVLAVGAAHALPILEILRTTDKTTRARLAVVAERDAQSALRELDRELLVTILSSDVPAPALATRLATVARRLAERAAAERASSRPPTVVTATATSSLRPLPSLLKTPGDRPAAERPKGLLALNSGAPVRRGTLSSDKLKAVPQPDLSLPQRADASKWRRSGRAHRVVLADDDVTRGAAIAQALIARGLEVQVVPLDPARTRWAQLQAHNPEVLIVDEVGSTDHRKVWLELFSADRVLSTARVIRVSLRSLFDENTLTVSLKALEKHIDGLAAWRHEMPTIIDDEERPTLVGGSDESGPHAIPAAADFDGDFDDRPTMARVPAGPVEPGPTRTPSYGPPSVQLNDSIIAESKKFLGAGPVPAPSPLPTHSSHPPRPITSPPTPASWRPVVPAPTPAPPPAAAAPPPAPAPGPAATPGVSSPLSSSPPAPKPPAPVFPGFSGDGLPTPGLVGGSSRSLATPASTRAPRLDLEPPAKKGRGLLWAGLAAAGLAGAGFWLHQTGQLGTGGEPPSAVSAGDGGSSDAGRAAPTTTDEGRAEVGSSAASGPAGASAGAEGLWTMGPGDALPCEKVVEPPSEVTALTLAAGTRAWEKARNLLVLGDMVGAQRQMCTAVLNHPQSLALEGLAALYLTLRTPTEGLRWVEQALAIRPDRPKTLELYGDVLVMLGREADARKAWLRGLGMPADGDKAVVLLARNLTDEADKTLRSGDTPRAEQLARRAAGLDMTSPRAAGTMAAVLLSAGQRELAQRWTARCIDLGADEPSCLLAQGDLAMANGDRKAARAHYEKVTRLAPGDRRAWQKLGGSTPRPSGESEPVGEEPQPPQVAPSEEAPSAEDPPTELAE